MAVRREFIAGLYNDLLGRQGSDQEISGWENAGSEDAVRAAFLGSPEYTSTHGGTATWHNDESGNIVDNPVRQTPSPSYDVVGQSDPGWPGGGIIVDPGTGTGGGSRSVVDNSAAQQVADFYTKYLGRTGSADELANWLSGAFGWGDANNLAGIERGISMSDEAARRRAATPGSSYSGSPYTGFNTNGGDYSAFNTARLQDPGKSAKDAFAMISNSAPPPPFGDKKALANWFTTYVKPGMDALGHKVLSVNEDGFTYTNGEGTFFVDFAQNAGATPGSMLQRLQWNATPADAATAARYAGSGGGSSSTNKATGSLGDLGSLLGRLGALGQQYGGPGGPGITNGPLQQVGQDPLSQLLTGGLVDFLSRGGRTALGDDVEGILKSLIATGGRSTGPVRRTLASAGGDAPAVGGDVNGIEPWMMGDGIGPDVSGEGSGDIVSQRFETARELMEKAKRTALNSARGDLAARNLLSEPGIPQGAEIGAVRRINEAADQDFATATRDIMSDEFTRADARMNNALSLMTGMSQDEAKTFLAGLGEGTARQQMLAQIALQSLQTNMAWSQFLAEFGLKRDQTLQMLQDGRVDDVMGLLNSFLTLASLSRGGYV